MISERIEITNHDPHAVYNFAASRFTWEIEPLPRSLLKSLYRRFRDTDGGSQDITPDRRLAVALHFTRDLLTTSEASEDILQILLEAAARRGNVAACALLPKVSSRAGVVYDNSEVMEWLTTAIVSGSLSARDDLQKLDAAAATKAVRCFEERGGYNMAYWDLDQITQPPSLIDANDTSQLHWLSAFGTIEQLRIFLDENPGIAINSMSERQETALYLACLRGSWEHVRTLLENNADPSIKCTTSGITCLHWTIAFDKGVCKLVVRSLVEAGADVNALTSLQQETPFPHYPFVLPSGAPLHWAATTSSNEAIQALVEQGASALLRNSCDPYMYDDRVRWLYAVGGPDSEGCTFPESNCLGLSSLDVAAIHRDPFLFRHLARESAVIDMNSADEEGFAVLHRLATNQTFRTSRRVAYSPRPIRSIKDVEVLQSIITAVIDLGGNTEMLTSNAETAKRKTQRSTDPSKSSYTPLMLAMLEGDEDLVDALLACGASVHTQNLSGETALFHTSHRANAEQSDLIKCVQKLVFSGANVNHHSSNGNSALLAAAQSQLLEVFDFLLCNGANIDETDRKERTTTPGKSVFACFASTKNGSDEKMLELLEKHILDARNVAKKDRVITGTADDGRTLLHEFASQAMPKCVKFLLKHGARVNVPLRQTRFIVANPRSEGKRVWYETPWDIMKVSREFVQDNMLVRNTHSLQQTKDLLERWDRCKELLEEYGGGPCEKPEHYEAWP
jgi:ankyrin repeat protein